jgi:hypothetical protein
MKLKILIHNNALYFTPFGRLISKLALVNGHIIRHDISMTKIWEAMVLPSIITDIELYTFSGVFESIDDTIYDLLVTNTMIDRYNISCHSKIDTEIRMLEFYPYTDMKKLSIHNNVKSAFEEYYKLIVILSNTNNIKPLIEQNEKITEERDLSIAKVLVLEDEITKLKSKLDTICSIISY